MKKSFNPISDARNDKTELTRRVSRSINEIAKQLDDVRGRAQAIHQLFLPNVEIQRVKLQEQCIRLIFSDPVGFGRKGEELLWRKVYHDVLTTAKLLKKKENWSVEEQGAVRSLLLCGVGHYQHLIMKLQVDYRLDLQGYLDFTICVSDTDLGLNKGRAWSGQQKTPDKAVVDWAREACHRCLIYLGDLHRYLLELQGQGWDCGTARRYYYQALYLDPKQGRPHNQLGTLAGIANYNLDATYHYAICLVSTEPFPGAEGNLLKSLDRNSEVLHLEQMGQLVYQPCPVQRLVMKMLHLFDVAWRLDRVDRDVTDACHAAVEALHCCSVAAPADHAHLAAVDVFEPEVDRLQPYAVLPHDKLNGDIVLKLLTLLVLGFDKVNIKDAAQASAVASVILAIISYTLQHLVTCLQDALVQNPGEEKKEVNGHSVEEGKTAGKEEAKKNHRLKRLKRRKRIRQNSLEESDGSESEDSNAGDRLEESSSEENGSRASESEEEEEDGVSSASEEGEEGKAEKNGVNGEAKKNAGPTVLQVLSERTACDMLAAVCVWLCSDHVKYMLKTCKTVLDKLTFFLNCLKMDDAGLTKLARLDTMKKDMLKIPLGEDVALRGLCVLKESQVHLDWMYHRRTRLTQPEETAVRMLRLRELGLELAAEDDSAVKVDPTTGALYVLGENGKRKCGPTDKGMTEGKTSRKGQLMKNMGQLWLKAEVRDLESRVRGRGGNFSPYVVVDAEALIEHIVVVKQLVGSRQFIVIIPAVVVQHLDECKRDSGRARETIRWLESQFQHGNRSLRAQKTQERFPLPLIKYPKKKDKEAWNFFQIMECCYYFSKQSEFESCRSSLLVTLLTGQKREVGQTKEEAKDFSPVGLAGNCGINLEHIEAFHTKWKLSSKSHG